MLYIHIGTQKTGSSSIQHVLNMNAPFLEKHSLRYLHAGRQKPADMRIHHNPVAAMLLSGDGARFGRELHRELAQSRCRNAILSGELLSQPGVATRLHDILPESLQDQIRIVVYLRRPDLYVESLFKQRVKADATTSTARQFLRQHHARLLHSQIIDEYADSFGEQSIILRPYDPCHLLNGNAVDDFLNVLGITETADLITPAEPANASFSLAFSQMSGLAVRQLQLTAPAITSAAQKLAPAGISRSRDVYHLDRRRWIVSQHADQIEALRRRFRPDLEALFDLSDLSEGAKDPFPTEKEQIKLMRDASAAIFRILPYLQEERKRPSLRRAISQYLPGSPFRHGFAFRRRPDA